MLLSFDSSLSPVSPSDLEEYKLCRRLRPRLFISLEANENGIGGINIGGGGAIMNGWARCADDIIKRAAASIVLDWGNIETE